MPIIQLLVILIVVGVGLWLINTYIPMSRPIKTLINVVVIVLAIIFVLNAFGILDGFWNYRMAR